MERLQAVLVVFIVAVAAVPVYMVLGQPMSPSVCGSNSGGPPPLGAPPVAIVYENTTKQGDTYWANFSFEISPTNLTVGQLTLRVTLPNGTISGEVRRYTLWNEAGQVIASANGTTSAWIEGSSVPMQSINVISVGSALSLTGDYLLGTLPDVCGGYATAVSTFG